MASSIALRAPRFALISGSLRKGSFNTKLIAAAEKVAKEVGAETQIVEIPATLPVYSQDEEAANGLPREALELKKRLGDADAWIVASPEYNGFPTPLLLNAYTYCSRGDADGDMYATFRDKLALILSASPGGLGGMRNHNPHRQLLQNLGVNVLASSVAVGGAYNAFDDETGELTSEKHRNSLESAVQNLFYVSRDAANRDATCELVKKHLESVGAYGSVPN